MTQDAIAPFTYLRGRVPNWTCCRAIATHCPVTIRGEEAAYSVVRFSAADDSSLSSLSLLISRLTKATSLL